MVSGKYFCFLFLDKNVCCEHSLEASVRRFFQMCTHKMFSSKSKICQYFLAEKRYLIRLVITENVETIYR